jgi:hypothetical protein
MLGEIRRIIKKQKKENGTRIRFYDDLTVSMTNTTMIFKKQPMSLNFMMI